MPSPFYRGSGGGGKSGPGVSGDGYDGAESLFEQAKTVAGELKLPFMPTEAQEAAAAKAAVDAYMSCRDGLVSANDAFFHQGNCPNEFPQVEINQNAGAEIGLKDGASPMDIGKAVTEMMSNMGDMLNQMVSNPMGVLSSILQFLFKLFTEVATGIGEAISEAARAAAAAVDEALKKQMEAASQAAQNGLQPLELYTQQATTQTLSHALKNTTST